MYVGDTVTFIHTVRDSSGRVVDISTATQLKLKFDRPGTLGGFTRDAALVTDGKDGKAQYTTAVTDLDVHGKWQRQLYLNLSIGEWSGDVHGFAVNARLTPIASTEPTADPSLLVVATKDYVDTTTTFKTEVPAGDIDGVNKLFTLSQAPHNNSLILELNGMGQIKGEDYTLSNAEITMANAPIGGVEPDKLRAKYL